jgi:Domain of unknown function (DUF4398)
MKSRQLLFIAAVLPLVLQACAYNRPNEVTAQMARTEATLQQAEQSGASQHSLPELQSARDKYADAKDALKKNNQEGDEKALQLAKQAQVDAQFASAKAQTTRQVDAAQDAEKGVDALRDEASRNANSPPSTAK